MVFRRVLVGLVLVVACAPQAADRDVVGVPENDADVDAAGGEDQVLADETPELDAELPRQPDRPRADGAVDAGFPPPDSASPADGGADLLVVMTALLVVGNADALTVGDARVQAQLVDKNLEVRIASDSDAVDVSGVALVVLTASCDSSSLIDRYKAVPVPVLVLEYLVFDEMGMVSGSGAFDAGETVAAQVNIVRPGHVMAAGLLGEITVVNPSSNLGWGRPSAGAERVAVIPDSSDQVVLFGYPAGATMSVGQAVARRVGCFVTDSTASRLNANGIKLLRAAIDWAME